MKIEFEGPSLSDIRAQLISFLGDTENRIRDAVERAPAPVLPPPTQVVDELDQALGPDEPPPKITHTDVTSALQKVMEAEGLGFTKVQAILKKFGATHLRDIEEKRWPELLKVVEKALK